MRLKWGIQCLQSFFFFFWFLELASGRVWELGEVCSFIVGVYFFMPGCSHNCCCLSRSSFIPLDFLNEPLIFFILPTETAVDAKTYCSILKKKYSFIFIFSSRASFSLFQYVSAYIPYWLIWNSLASFLSVFSKSFTHKLASEYSTQFWRSPTSTNALYLMWIIEI